MEKNIFNKFSQSSLIEPNDDTYFPFNMDFHSSINMLIVLFVESNCIRNNSHHQAICIIVVIQYFKLFPASSKSSFISPCVRSSPISSAFDNNCSMNVWHAASHMCDKFTTGECVVSRTIALFIASFRSTVSDNTVSLHSSSC